MNPGDGEKIKRWKVKSQYSRFEDSKEDTLELTQLSFCRIRMLIISRINDEKRLWKSL